MSSFTEGFGSLASEGNLMAAANLGTKSWLQALHHQPFPTLRSASRLRLPPSRGGWRCQRGTQVNFGLARPTGSRPASASDPATASLALSPAARLDVGLLMSASASLHRPSISRRSQTLRVGVGLPASACSGRHLFSIFASASHSRFGVGPPRVGLGLIFARGQRRGRVAFVSAPTYIFSVASGSFTKTLSSFTEAGTGSSTKYMP